MKSYNFQMESIPLNMASSETTIPITFSVYYSTLIIVGLAIWITIGFIWWTFITCMHNNNTHKYHEEHIRLLNKLVDINSRTITLMQKVFTGNLELQRRMTKAHEQCHWCSHMVPGTRTPRTQGAELEQDSTLRRWDGSLSRGCTRDESTTQWYSGKRL
ncbi:hypothetical protein QR685DRAFT_575427 [Neurospora intermedia]|uniref:Uncharacterized protein n=1 Tax=Neurospora intermedia TaxID=5142 RepID=A0ABR3D0T3_NEUIN